MRRLGRTLGVKTTRRSDPPQERAHEVSPLCGTLVYRVAEEPSRHFRARIHPISDDGDLGPARAVPGTGMR